jgi:multidrug transporter EmrE-like cation transporter
MVYRNHAAALEFKIMNNPVYVIFLIVITVILNTVAQFFLKLGADQKSLNLFLLAGVCFYGLSTIVYVLVLGKFNLSIAYPVIIGSTVIATVIVGAILFREKVEIAQWIGVGLTISGISAIALGKRL